MEERELCPHSGKVMFPSRNEARKVAKRMVERVKKLRGSHQRSAPPEVYICKGCHAYHIGRSVLRGYDKRPYERVKHGSWEDEGHV